MNVIRRSSEMPSTQANIRALGNLKKVWSRALEQLRFLFNFGMVGVY